LQEVRRDGIQLWRTFWNAITAIATITKQKNINTAVSIAVLDFAGSSAKRDRRPVLRKSRNRGASSLIRKDLSRLAIFDTVNLLSVPGIER
jgi:hypothetical protein